MTTTTDRPALTNNCCRAPSTHSASAANGLAADSTDCRGGVPSGRAPTLDRSLEQVPVGAAPTDPRRHLIKDAGFLPRRLRLSSFGRELPGTLPNGLLLGEDFVNETSGRREPVRLGESFHPSPPV